MVTISAWRPEGPRNLPRPYDAPSRSAPLRLDVPHEPREPVAAHHDVVRAVVGDGGSFGAVADGDGPGCPFGAVGKGRALGLGLVGAARVCSARLRVDEVARAVDAVL